MEISHTRPMPSNHAVCRYPTPKPSELHTPQRHHTPTSHPHKDNNSNNTKLLRQIVHTDACLVTLLVPKAATTCRHTSQLLLPADITITKVRLIPLQCCCSQPCCCFQRFCCCSCYRASVAVARAAHRPSPCYCCCCCCCYCVAALAAAAARTGLCCCCCYATSVAVACAACRPSPCRCCRCDAALAAAAADAGRCCCVAAATHAPMARQPWPCNAHSMQHAARSTQHTAAGNQVSCVFPGCLRHKHAALPQPDGLQRPSPHPLL
jgi:hypothetical protein